MRRNRRNLRFRQKLQHRLYRIIVSSGAKMKARIRLITPIESSLGPTA